MLTKLTVFSIPGSGLGSAIAYTFVTRYSVGWRGIYWFLLAINGTALVCWVAFYFPPTFEEKHKTDIESKMYWLKHFDYFGMFLFASGFVVFLMGMLINRSYHLFTCSLIETPYQAFLGVAQSTLGTLLPSSAQSLSDLSFSSASLYGRYSAQSSNHLSRK